MINSWCCWWCSELNYRNVWCCWWCWSSAAAAACWWWSGRRRTAATHQDSPPADVYSLSGAPEEEKTHKQSGVILQLGTTFSGGLIHICWVCTWDCVQISLSFRLMFQRWTLTWRSGKAVPTLYTSSPSSAPGSNTARDVTATTTARSASFCRGDTEPASLNQRFPPGHQ